MLVSSILIGVPLSYCYGFAVGFLFHLIQDTFTKQGVAWLYPFSKKRYVIIGIKSNGCIFIEWLLSIFAAIPIILLFLFIRDPLVVVYLFKIFKGVKLVY